MERLLGLGRVTSQWDLGQSEPPESARVRSRKLARFTVYHLRWPNVDRVEDLT